jgi:hypothetical protein
MTTPCSAYTWLSASVQLLTPLVVAVAHVITVYLATLRHKKVLLRLGEVASSVAASDAGGGTQQPPPTPPWACSTTTPPQQQEACRP